MLMHVYDYRVYRTKNSVCKSHRYNGVQALADNLNMLFDHCEIISQSNNGNFQFTTNNKKITHMCIYSPTYNLHVKKIDANIITVRIKKATMFV